ncbi:MAG TPA: hypothetical protein VND19_05345 [Acetobacteraceae bacterium]|nr:hypothetical protein [Acetobacteraceae bacterium]
MAFDDLPDDTYRSGNTRVTTTLGSAATTVRVDDVRGFFVTMNAQNVPVSVSTTAILTVVVGSDTATLTACRADGSVPATPNPCSTPSVPAGTWTPSPR